MMKEEETTLCCSSSVDYWFHVGMLGIVIPVGLIALIVGHERHGFVGPLSIGSVGMLMLIGALGWGTNLWGGAGEQILTVSGSLAMVSAHLWNRRQCHCCQSPHLSELVQLETEQSEKLLPQSQ